MKINLTLSLPLLSTRRQGLSLLELLVSIAIAATLITLLVASVGSMTAKARQSSCLNNMRQIGMGFQMYWNDNNGQSMGYASEPYEEGTSIWFMQLLLGDFVKPSILVCPEDKDPYGPYGPPATWCSYGVVAPFIFPFQSPWRVASITDRSKRILLVDNHRWSYISQTTPSLTNGESPTPRHNGQFNILWLDLHATPAKSISDYNLNLGL